METLEELLTNPTIKALLANKRDGSKMGQMSGLPEEESGEPMPFAGPDAAPAPGATAPQSDGLDAISMALTGSKGIQSPIPVPSPGTGMRVGQDVGGGEMVPRSTLPLRPQVDKESVIRALSNNWLNPELKQLMLQTYMNQNQPVEGKALGGSVVVGRDGKQRFVPDLQKNMIKGGGGMEVPSYTYIGPDGKVHRIQNADMPPESGGLPAAPSSSGEKPPSIMEFADSGAGIDGMLGKKPPQGQQSSQYIDPYAKRQIEELQDMEVKQKGRIEQSQKQAESFVKQYNDVVDSGQRAQAAKAKLGMAKELVDTPEFISGILSDPRIALQKLKAWVGKDPNKAVASEMFQKIMSGDVLEEMKVLLKGLGQVRVAEIQLLGQATANQHLTPEGNKAVLDLMMRGYDRAQKLGELANAYSQGWRRVDGKVVKTNNKGLDEGFNDEVTRYTNLHPLVNDAEIQNFKHHLGGNNFNPKKALADADKYAGMARDYGVTISGDNGKPTAHDSFSKPAEGGKKPAQKGLPPGFEIEKR